MESRSLVSNQQQVLSALVLEPASQEEPNEPMTPTRFLAFSFRLLAGFLFIPIAIYYSLNQRKNEATVMSSLSALN